MILFLEQFRDAAIAVNDLFFSGVVHAYFYNHCPKLDLCHIKNGYLETEVKQINLSVFYPVDVSTYSFCDLNTQIYLCAELGVWLSEEERLLCKHKDLSSNLQLHIKKSSLTVHVCNHSLGGQTQVDPKSSLISWP